MTSVGGNESFVVGAEGRWRNGGSGETGGIGGGVWVNFRTAILDSLADIWVDKVPLAIKVAGGEGKKKVGQKVGGGMHLGGKTLVTKEIDKEAVIVGRVARTGVDGADFGEKKIFAFQMVGDFLKGGQGVGVD